VVQGKVRHVGLSNETPYGLTRAVLAAGGIFGVLVLSWKMHTSRSILCTPAWYWQCKSLLAHGFCHFRRLKRHLHLWASISGMRVSAWASCTWETRCACPHS